MTNENYDGYGMNEEEFAAWKKEDKRHREEEEAMLDRGCTCERSKEKPCPVWGHRSELIPCDFCKYVENERGQAASERDAEDAWLKDAEYDPEHWAVGGDAYRN